MTLMDTHHSLIDITNRRSDLWKSSPVEDRLIASNDNGLKDESFLPEVRNQAEQIISECSVTDHLQKEVEYFNPTLKNFLLRLEMDVGDAESIQFLQTCCDCMSYCIISYWSLGQFTVNMIDKDFVKDCPAKRVAVGVWASTTQTTHTPGFISNFHWYRTTDKSSYSNRNSAKQVEGLPETTMTPSHVVKVIAQ